jgi:hypothetical protein
VLESISCNHQVLTGTVDQIDLWPKGIHQYNRKHPYHWGWYTVVGMGKTSRKICLITPLSLTVASLICLIIVMVGQLSSNNKAPPTSLGRDLYFLKVCQLPLSLLQRVDICYRQTQANLQLTHERSLTSLIMSMISSISILKFLTFYPVLRPPKR